MRKLVGASQTDIKQQFLFESIVLTFIGDVVGIILGVLIAYMLNKFETTSTEVSSFSIIISFSVSVVIGIIFGYYPPPLDVPQK